MSSNGSYTLVIAWRMWVDRWMAKWLIELSVWLTVCMCVFLSGCRLCVYSYWKREEWQVAPRVLQCCQWPVLPPVKWLSAHSQLVSVCVEGGVRLQEGGEWLADGMVINKAMCFSSLAVNFEFVGSHTGELQRDRCQDELSKSVISQDWLNFSLSAKNKIVHFICLWHKTLRVHVVS